MRLLRAWLLLLAALRALVLRRASRGAWLCCFAFPSAQQMQGRWARESMRKRRIREIDGLISRRGLDLTIAEGERGEERARERVVFVLGGRREGGRRRGDVRGARTASPFLGRRSGCAPHPQLTTASRPPDQVRLLAILRASPTPHTHTGARDRSITQGAETPSSVSHTPVVTRSPIHSSDAPGAPRGRHLPLDLDHCEAR
jgi:hypothetical protein